MFANADDSDPEVVRKVFAATQRESDRARIELYVIGWPNRVDLHAIALQARTAVVATSVPGIRDSLRKISDMPPPESSIKTLFQ